MNIYLRYIQRDRLNIGFSDSTLVQARSDWDEYSDPGTPPPLEPVIVHDVVEHVRGYMNLTVGDLQVC